MDFSCIISLFWTFHYYYSTFTIHFTKYVSLLIFIFLTTEKKIQSFISWQKLFKSRLARAFHAGAKYYFNFIICIFALLFAGKKNNWCLIKIIFHSLDSIRELRKYSGNEVTDLNTPHAEAYAHMKQFRSQRNFYIAGFALFLWLYVKENLFLLNWEIFLVSLNVWLIFYRMLHVKCLIPKQLVNKLKLLVVNSKDVHQMIQQ